MTREYLSSLFARIVNDFRLTLLTTFIQISIVDICRGLEYIPYLLLCKQLIKCFTIHEIKQSVLRSSDMHLDLEFTVNFSLFYPADVMFFVFFGRQNILARKIWHTSDVSPDRHLARNLSRLEKIS